jgi:hypothetical protein
MKEEEILVFSRIGYDTSLEIAESIIWTNVALSGFTCRFRERARYVRP